MAKYSSEELRAMAKVVIDDYNANGHASSMLIMIISMKTGMHPNAVLAKIRSYL